MLSKEVFREWFNKEVQPRWGKCEFAWTELGDWHWRLEKFDIDTLTEAVRRHKVEDGCGCVGWFVPILIWPFHKTYTPETYRRIAEEQRVMHSRNGRDGVWKIFTGTTHGEMMTRRMKLRGEKPLDLNQLRKLYKIKPR